MLELAIVIAIVGILTAIGIGSVRNLLPRYRMIQVSKQLKNDLAGLRVLAIEQNREARLKLDVSDPSWTDASTPQAGRWQLQVGDRHLNSRTWDTLPIDSVDGVDRLTGEGTIDLGEGGNRETADVSLVPWGAFKGPGVNNMNTIVFSPKGWVTNPAGDFSTTGYIELTLVNKAALIEGIDDSVTLHISRAGMVRVESSLSSGFEGSDAGTEAVSTGGGA
jgi:type II secretory pathway pseudopilin PulG